jgi:hypothetical protein
MFLKLLLYCHVGKTHILEEIEPSMTDLLLLFLISGSIFRIHLIFEMLLPPEP